jgi:hypothetical protein
MNSKKETEMSIKFKMNTMVTSLLAAIFLGVFSGVLFATPYDDAKAYWRLDEASGFLAHDYLGGNYGNLTGMSGTEWAPGKINNSLSLDGVNDFINIGDKELVSTAFSFTAWVNPVNAATGDQNILSKYQTFGDNRSYVIRIGGNDVFIGVSSDGTNASGKLTQLETTTNKLTNDWNFIAATYDGSTIALFVNGSTPEASITHSGGVYGGGVAPIWIGRQSYNYFSGMVDEMAVWDRALSQAEMATLYNNGAGIEAIPEPATFTYVGLGLLALARCKRAFGR